MRIPAGDPRSQEVIDLVSVLGDLMQERKESEEVAISAMAVLIGTVLGHICITEDSLLRAITMINDGVRSAATDTFVAHKRRVRRRL